MRRCIFLLAGLLAFVTSGGLALFGRPPAVARDRILPLKIRVGEKAPNFVLSSADGKTVRLSDYAGHNVLIDFYRGYW
jgi:AhpC/TSA family